MIALMIGSNSARCLSLFYLVDLIEIVMQVIFLL